MSMSVTETGVQIVRQNPGWCSDLVKSYLPGDPLWSFLEDLAAREFGTVPEVKDKTLVRVDMRPTETQFSWQ